MKAQLKAARRRMALLFMSREARRHALVGPPQLWEMKRKFQIDYLRAQGLRPEHVLLDIGCGTLRGGIPLIDYLQPGHYHGVETRAEVLDEGRRELQEAGLSGKAPVLWVSEDLGGEEREHRYNWARAFSVLIHMPDAVAEGTLSFLGRHLVDDGQFHANVNLGERREGNWQGFPVVWRSLDFYRDMAARHGLQVEDVGSLHALGHRSGAESQDEQRMLRFWRAG